MEQYKQTFETEIQLVEGTDALRQEVASVVKFPQIDTLRAEYQVGMTHVPVALKFAIRDQVNHMYDNRGAGAEGMGICEKAWRACQQFNRTSPIL